jgi:hypothetical protein
MADWTGVGGQHRQDVAAGGCGPDDPVLAGRSSSKPIGPSDDVGAQGRFLPYADASDAHGGEDGVDQAAQAMACSRSSMATPPERRPLAPEPPTTTVR